MRYTTDHTTGATLAHNGPPETAGRAYSNHRTLSGARRAVERLNRLDQGATHVIIDNTTGEIVDDRS